MKKLRPLLICLMLVFVTGCTNPPVIQQNTASALSEDIAVQESSASSTEATDTKPKVERSVLEKVVIQVPSKDTQNPLRIMEADDGELHLLADRISRTILKAVVWGKYDIKEDAISTADSQRIALAESSEEVVFEDDRYYQALDSDPSSSWIRLYYQNFSPKGTPAGGSPSTNKDIVVWIDPLNSDDALFAWQSLEDTSTWTTYRLPGFGEWLKIELMFCNR